MKISVDKPFSFAAILLALLVTISYGYCLWGYFLADDTWQVQFAYRVLNGESNLLWANFGRSYLSLPALDFYRPLLGFTFVGEYLLYGLNAWGYYLTNVVMAYLATLFFFMSVRALTADFGSSRAYFCALSAAALFASSPLHCEDICWISGRADLLAAVFYLPALYLAIVSWRSTGKRALRLYLFSLLCYVLSLISKESAVGLPVLIAALPLVCTRASDDVTSNEAKPVKHGAVKHWLKFSLPYFVILVPYFIVRTLALGSPIGGYTGDMGKALSRWLLYRWVDPTTVWRLVFPLPHCIFPDDSMYVTVILTLYAAICGLLIVRLVTERLQWRGLLFVVIMAFQALLPLYKLWGLDQDMHNQRIYYFFTMPLSLLLPWLVFAPRLSTRAVGKNPMPGGLEVFVNLLTTTLFCIIASVFAFVSFSVSASWVNAGDQVRALRARSSELVAAHRKPVILLGIPKGLDAAHILLCGFCFKELFEPPFTSPSISDRLLTFHSCVAGPDEPINTTRFKQTLASGEADGPFLWSTKEKKYTEIVYDKVGSAALQPLNIPLSKTAKLREMAPLDNLRSEFMVSNKDGGVALALADMNNKGGLLVEGLDCNPLERDYLSFDVALQPGFNVYAVSVQFDDQEPGTPFVGDPQVVQAISVEPDKSVPAKADRDAAGRLKLKWVHVNVHMSHFWRWYSKAKVKRLKLSFLYADHLVVKNIQLKSDRDFVPVLSMQKLKRRSSGEYVVGRDPIVLDFDAANIPGAKQAQFVITYVNESFDNFLFFDEHKGSSVEAVRLASPCVRGLVNIDSKYFQENGYYEMKARALDEQNRPVGDWSDVITIYRPSDKGSAPYYAGN
jgi:hypothetical protein